MNTAVFVNRVMWWLRLGPFFEWRDRRRVRQALLDTPGVDRLVREVMDAKYGKHAWRVRDGNLEAMVQSEGQGSAWWGLIGPLRSRNTRSWLANMSLDLNGVGQSENKPAEAPYKIESPVVRSSPYWGAYQDTIPTDDTKEKS